jgi:hypothetical protein
MGNLIPGATYIYENDGQKIYARAAGSQDRVLVGETMYQVYQQREEDHLWRSIRETAKTNPALQDALDTALIVYELSKKDG